MTMICDLLPFPIFSKQWDSPIGLAADVLGVILLSIDLIRVQYSQKKRTRAALAKFRKMASEFGGVKKWVELIEQSANWEDQPHYWHWGDAGDNEVSYNAKRSTQAIDDISQCVQLLATETAKMVALQHEEAITNNQAASESLLVSYVGLFLIVQGVILQFSGSLPC